MNIEIDSKSGFCFGVTNAVKKAEEVLAQSRHLYCLGDIVHNSAEVSRLQKMGLKIIGHSEFFGLKNCAVLIRAHGEPPSTYEYARKNNIDIIDATCPVVLNLQKRVKKAFLNMQEQDGQVIIFGKKGHPEVEGLKGQTENKALIVENESDLTQVDLRKPSVLFSQTTKSLEHFAEISEKLKSMTGGKAEIKDTICRQVFGRISGIKSFAAGHDVIIFVGGEKSSNAKYLFETCLQVNPDSHFVTEPGQIDKTWFGDRKNVGLCGATSTPGWLLREVAEKIGQF